MVPFSVVEISLFMAWIFILPFMDNLLRIMFSLRNMFPLKDPLNCLPVISRLVILRVLFLRVMSPSILSKSSSPRPKISLKSCILPSRRENLALPAPFVILSNLPVYDRVPLSMPLIRRPVAAWRQEHFPRLILLKPLFIFTGPSVEKRFAKSTSVRISPPYASVFRNSDSLPERSLVSAGRIFNVSVLKIKSGLFLKLI